MTNDSHLFRTAAQLEADGFYPVQGNRWKKGEELYLPLYEGKMVQAFDHRAASVVVNPENLNRPAQPREAKLDEHANPNWLPDTTVLGSQSSFDGLRSSWTIALQGHFTHPRMCGRLSCHLCPCGVWEQSTNLLPETILKNGIDRNMLRIC